MKRDESKEIHSGIKDTIDVEKINIQQPSIIMLNRGINEIIGESGAGKTALAIYISNGKKTLYISSRMSKERWFPQEFIIKRIDSFLKLRVFITSELRGVTKEFNIECIIIDDLEDYLYSFKKPWWFASEIFNIVRILKDLSFNDAIQVIVVNNRYDGLRVENAKILNSYFGIRWEYMINSRYTVSRRFGQRVVNIQGESGDKAERNFIIDNCGVHF